VLPEPATEIVNGFEHHCPGPPLAATHDGHNDGLTGSAAGGPLTDQPLRLDGGTQDRPSVPLASSAQDGNDIVEAPDTVAATKVNIVATKDALSTIAMARSVRGRGRRI
jgi:hypothetical protein